MTIKSIFDDDFTNDFFRRRRTQFPSLFDSSSIFDDAKFDFDKIIKVFREEVEAMNKRSGIEFQSRAFNEDPFAFSKSLTNFMQNDRIFDSSRAIESGTGIGNGISCINSSNNTLSNMNNSSSIISNNNSNKINRSLTNFGDETSTPGKYTLNIPLGNRIQPEDLKISLKEENGLKIMSIEAKREEKSEDANRKSFVSQQFSRQFTLPQNVEINDVQSILTEGGNLKIEAPLKELPAPKPQIQQQQQQRQVTHHIPIETQNQVAVKRYGTTTIPISLEQ